MSFESASSQPARLSAVPFATDLAERGLCALFAAIMAAASYALNAEFELANFKDRVVSTPSVEGLDVVARTGIFPRSIVLFAITFVAALGLFRLLAKVTTRATWRALDALAIAGCAAWLARAYGMPADITARMVGIFSLAVLAIGCLDRLVFRRDAPQQYAAYLIGLGIAALGTDLAYFDFAWKKPGADFDSIAATVASTMVGLHVVLRCLAIRGDAKRAEIVLTSSIYALSLLAFVPFISMLRDELYLTVNQMGWKSISPNWVELAPLAPILLLALVRFLRARGRTEPVDLDATVFRFAAPVFAFGITVIAHYFALIEVSNDFFEPANPELSIQQFFDFGRLPFLETFNAHGFSDAFWGFVYRLLHDGRDEVNGFYEFMNPALASMLVYWLVRRTTSNGPLALFVALFAAFRIDVFPPYCEFAIATLFVLERTLAAPTRLRFGLLVAYCAACFLWRLDLGAANLVAVVGTLVLTRLNVREFRPRILDAVIGGGIAAGVLVLLAVGLAILRGVDLPHRLLTLSHVITSSQGFGNVIARIFTPEVLWHLAVFPLIVLFVLAGTLVVQRLAGEVTRERAFLHLFIVFGAIYYFANAQRGLVRHTFAEPGNVYILSFGYAVSLATIELATNLSARTRAIAYLGIATILAGSFGLQGPLPVSTARYFTVFQRAVFQRTSRPHLIYHRNTIDRSVITPALESRQLGAVREFIQANLRDDQTFVDLTNSPMLFALLHRRSPHYLNHLFLAHDEWLQRNEVVEFDRADAPLVFAWMDDEFATRDGENANHHNFGDTVHNSLRQWLFHEWLNEKYEPWRVVQHWQVWRRKDWVTHDAPVGSDAREISKGRPDGTGSVRLASENGMKPLVETGRDRISYLEIASAAESTGYIDLEVEYDPAPDSDGVEQPQVRISRRLALNADASPLYWTLPFDSVGSVIRSIRVSAADGVALEQVTLNDIVAAAYASMRSRSKLRICPTFGKVAWLWANADDRNARERPTLRELTYPQNAPDKRMFFGPLEDRYEPCYVLVRLAARPSKLEDDTIGVVFGNDNRSIGRVNFDLYRDGAQDYLVRISSQFTWSQHAINWIHIDTGSTNAKVLSARILKGD